MDTSSFVTSLVTSVLIFVVLYVLHNWLSRKPGNAVVYYPSKILNNIPPPTSHGLFSWVREAWSAREEHIVLHAGLDATIYMIFLSSALWICIYTALYCIPVLIPLSGTDDHFDGLSSSNFDKLTMGNVTARSSRLWAFAIADYWLTIATFYVLWKSHEHVVYLRTQDMSSSKAKLRQYAILVRDIPKPSAGSISDEVDTLFRTLHPTTYKTCIVVSKKAKASKLWKKIDASRQKLARAEALLESSKKRPTHRTGKFGLYGRRVDSIDYHTEVVEKLAPLLKDEQDRTRSKSQQGAAIVIFNSRAAATSASQVMYSQYSYRWTTMAAPEPREVIWNNLPIPFVRRRVQQLVVSVIVFLAILLFMIPVGFIAAIIGNLANGGYFMEPIAFIPAILGNFANGASFMRPIVAEPVLKSILQAYVPQLVLMAFLALLPMLLSRLSRLEGIPSQSHVVRATAGKHFYFNVFNVFLGVTLVGCLYNSLNDLMSSPWSIVTVLTKCIPLQATFFMTFVALTIFVGYGFKLSRIMPLTIFHFKRKFRCKTEEEVRNAWAPGHFNYATRVPGDMLILTITMCYSVIEPVILFFAIAYFGLGWLLMRNQALNVKVPRYESGGTMWPHIHSQILASLLLSQVILLGYFGYKNFDYTSLMITPVIATMSFAYICGGFDRSFSASSLSATWKEVTEAPSTEAVVEAYTPACLRPMDHQKSSDADKQDPEKQDGI